MDYISYPGGGMMLSNVKKCVLAVPASILVTSTCLKRMATVTEHHAMQIISGQLESQ